MSHEALPEGVREHYRHLLESHVRASASTAGIVVTLDARLMILDDATVMAGIDRFALWKLVERAGAAAHELRLPSGQTVGMLPIDRGHLGSGCSVVFPRRDTAARPMASLGPIEQAEYDVIVSVMRSVHGNKKAAAERLRISRGTLYERLRRYRISEA